MDGQQVDHLTHMLSGNTPRRRVLKGLVGGLAAGLLGLYTVKPTLAITTHAKTLERLDAKCVKEFGDAYDDVISVQPVIDPSEDSCRVEDGECVCDVDYTCQYDPTNPDEGQFLFWQRTKRVVVPSTHCA